MTAESSVRALFTLRRVRGTLAFGQLEFASRRWMQHGWDVDRDETHALLPESWLHLLVG